MRGDHSAPWSITSSKSRQIESSWAGTPRYCMWASASRTRASGTSANEAPAFAHLRAFRPAAPSSSAALGDSCIDRCDQQLEVARDRERQQIGVAAGRNPAGNTIGPHPHVVETRSRGCATGACRRRPTSQRPSRLSASALDEAEHESTDSGIVIEAHA